MWSFASLPFVEQEQNSLSKAIDYWGSEAWLAATNTLHGVETQKGQTKRNMLPNESAPNSRIGNIYLKAANIKDFMSLTTSVITEAEKLGINIGSMSSQPGINGVTNITLFPTENESTGTGTNTINENKTYHITKQLQDWMNKQCGCIFSPPWPSSYSF